LFTSVRHNILLDILGHNSSNVPIKPDVEQIYFYTNISSSLIDSKLIMRKKKKTYLIYWHQTVWELLVSLKY